MIFRELIAGSKPNINNELIVDEHCQLVLQVLKNDKLTSEKFLDSAKVFESSRKQWINDLKKDQFRIKDVKEFTDLVIKLLDEYFSSEAIS